jgi:hypothetical protein
MKIPGGYTYFVSSKRRCSTIPRDDSTMVATLQINSKHFHKQRYQRDRIKTFNGIKISAAILMKSILSIFLEKK